MNIPIPILSAHVVDCEFDARDLAFARLGALAEDVGGTLSAMARLCGKPTIPAILDQIDGLHRTPDGADDQKVISFAVALLESLADELAGIPPTPEITSVILDTDRSLVANLDAAVRYAGARVEDNARALKQLLD